MILKTMQINSAILAICEQTTCAQAEKRGVGRQFTIVIAKKTVSANAYCNVATFEACTEEYT